jgi:hypothetical protein
MMSTARTNIQTVEQFLNAKRQVAESNFRGHPTKTTDKSFLEYEQADEDE